jgi:hypothetical protein
MDVAVREWLRAAAVGLLGSLAIACGSGGGDATTVVDAGVWIDRPTDGDRYATDQPTVRLEGRAFVPAGAACTGLTGTLPPGYTVRWRNEATGESLAAQAQLNCLLTVVVSWRTADVPLAIGANRIVVEAQSADGRTGGDALLVDRVPDVTPPAVIAIRPSAGATHVDTGTTIDVTFSEPVDEASLRRGWTVRVLGAPATVAGSIVAGQPAQYTFFPDLPLLRGTTYEVRIADVTDRNGLALPAPFVATFTTAP